MEPAATVLFYVQHLLGVGHLRRTLAIAEACSERGVEVHVASGGMPLEEAPSPKYDFHQLPPVRIAGRDFSRLLQADGTPVDDRWRSSRKEQLSQLTQRIRPRTLVTELYPFGRRQLRFELLPLLDSARALRSRVVCSVRDVVQKREIQREQETVDILNGYYDEVLVHGDSDFLPLHESFSLTEKIRCSLHYTGLVSTAHQGPAGHVEEGEVIVSAGGGAVGTMLYQSAVRAAELDCVRHLKWRILVGSQAEGGLSDKLSKEAPANVRVESNRPDFQGLLGQARLSVSQAGYNSVVDILVSGVPALLVPFRGDGSETEQAMRARRLKQMGRADFIEEAELSPEKLARTVARLVGAVPWRLPSRACEGGRMSAELIASWANQ